MSSAQGIPAGTGICCYEIVASFWLARCSPAYLPLGHDLHGSRRGGRLRHLQRSIGQHAFVLNCPAYCSRDLRLDLACVFRLFQAELGVGVDAFTLQQFASEPQPCRGACSPSRLACSTFRPGFPCANCCACPCNSAICCCCCDVALHPLESLPDWRHPRGFGRHEPLRFVELHRPRRQAGSPRKCAAACRP